MSRDNVIAARKEEENEGQLGPSGEHFEKLHSSEYGSLENGKIGVYLCYIDREEFRSEWVYMTHVSNEKGDFSNLARGFHKLQMRNDNKDIFMSMNTFYGSREEQHAKYLNAFYVDCDYYNKPGHRDRPAEEVAEDALNHLKMLDFPLPTHVISSGKGFQLIWCIHKVALSNHWRDARVRWKCIQEYLYTSLRQFGADPNALDISRVFRVAGTVNSKNGNMVKMLWELEDGYYRYDFEEVAAKVLPMARDEHRAHIADLNAARTAKKAKAKKGKTGKKRRKGPTILDLHQNRIADLKRLAKYRHPYGVPEGQRDWFVFLTSVSLSYLNHADSFLSRVMDYAYDFAPELTEKQVKSMIHANQKRLEKAEAGDVKDGDPRYRYKTKTLIEKLSINDIEMRAAGLKTLVYAEIKKDQNKENCSRWHDEQDPGRIERRQTREENHSEIMRLAATGMSQRKIAAEVHMSRGAVENVLKKPDVQNSAQDLSVNDVAKDQVFENACEKAPEAPQEPRQPLPRLIGRKLKKKPSAPRKPNCADVIAFPTPTDTRIHVERTEAPEGIPFFNHEMKYEKQVSQVAVGDCPF